MIHEDSFGKPYVHVEAVYYLARLVAQSLVFSNTGNLTVDPDLQGMSASSAQVTKPAHQDFSQVLA